MAFKTKACGNPHQGEFVMARLEETNKRGSDFLRQAKRGELPPEPGPTFDKEGRLVFKFDLGDRVRVLPTGQHGFVVGRELIERGEYTVCAKREHLIPIGWFKEEELDFLEAGA